MIDPCLPAGRVIRRLYFRISFEKAVICFISNLSSIVLRSNNPCLPPGREKLKCVYLFCTPYNWKSLTFCRRTCAKKSVSRKHLHKFYHNEHFNTSYSSSDLFSCRNNCNGSAEFVYSDRTLVTLSLEILWNYNNCSWIFA